MGLVTTISCDGECGHIATAESADSARLMLRIRPTYPGDQPVDMAALSPVVQSLVTRAQANGGQCYLCVECFAALLTTTPAE